LKITKITVGLFPRPIRDMLKRVPKLTAFYRRLLIKNNLIREVVSVSQQTKRYHQYLAEINEHQSTKWKDDGDSFDILVCIEKFDGKALSLTLKSIVQTNNRKESQTYILCSDGLVKEVKDFIQKSEYACTTLSVISPGLIVKNALNIDKALFFIRCGDSLNENVFRIFSDHESFSAKIIYSDVDTLNIFGVRENPLFFPDWNPDLQMSTRYICTGFLVKSSEDFLNSFHRIVDFSTAADWISEQYILNENLIIDHISQISVHKYHEDASKESKTLSSTLHSLVSKVAVVDYDDNFNIFKYTWHIKGEPLVSLIIPTKNAKNLVEVLINSILAKTTYNNYEIILVDNNSDDVDSLRYFEELSNSGKVRLLKYPFPFNYSAINNYAVTFAKGQIIGFINNDIEVIEPAWLEIMVSNVCRKDIGCVGAKLLYPNGLIQHAGVVMGYGGGAGHAHKYFPRNSRGYLKRLVATNNFSAVTAACMLVKKIDFIEVGGFNEKDLTVAFNDVDLCLKVLGLGKRNLYCADAVLYHHESISRGEDNTIEKQLRFNAEVCYIQNVWKDIIKNDPAYNVNLTLKFENFTVLNNDEVVRL
jgi:O-antigen biosynthesis protein